MQRALVIPPVLLCAVVVAAAPTLAADNSFFRVLASKPNATFEDACRCMAMLVEMPVPEDFSELKAQLAEKSIIPRKWLEEKTAEERLTRGVMAYMVCTSLDIKGGLVMHLLGPTPRYALRECIFLKLVARSAETKLVTGAELLAVLGRVEKYKNRHAQGEEPETEE